jgi:hypothetical protein
MRRWQGLTRSRICGTDYNPQLVGWCEANLPFGEFGSNKLAPPLTYANNEFDVIYAISVFTHLTEELQRQWIAELTRILKVGGYLILTCNGGRYLDRLNSEERERFLAGHVVVKDDVSNPGSNTCAAYHPESYVKTQFGSGPLNMVEFVASGVGGVPHQDLYVLRKV